MGASTFSETDFDVNHSDMSFANDSIGYLASGSLLYYLKKYIPVIVIPEGLNNITNKKLIIKITHYKCIKKISQLYNLNKI